ncbi:exoribonuclease II [Salmonella enterica subsp. enterica serovar Heidelberg str. 75-3547]|nr:exoribonuclease II [Salmonella enterica subsp. enterica serovar Heidelberg str. 75-3547]
MFQDNPLLAQLKQQLHSQTPRAEGVVKATEKGFGFLEVDAQKSYFIPPPQMKKSDAWRSYRRGHPHGKRT